MNKFYLPLLKDCLLTELDIPKNFGHILECGPQLDNDPQVTDIRNRYSYFRI